MIVKIFVKAVPQFLKEEQDSDSDDIEDFRKVQRQNYSEIARVL